MPLHSFEMQPIGIIHSPYKEKFAIPRQPRLASQVISHIQLQGEINTPEAVRGLSDFSHIWLLFLFDQNLNAGWKPTVRPPRLGKPAARRSSNTLYISSKCNWDVSS